MMARKDEDVSMSERGKLMAEPSSSEAFRTWKDHLSHSPALGTGLGMGR